MLVTNYPGTCANSARQPVDVKIQIEKERSQQQLLAKTKPHVDVSIDWP
jgi:hypothetical protein